MAHDVSFTVPERPLGKVDVEFNVKKDGEVLGTVKVSKGSIEWRPRNCTRGFHLRWSQFDALMQEKGKQK